MIGHQGAAAAGRRPARTAPDRGAPRHAGVPRPAREDREGLAARPAPAPQAGLLTVRPGRRPADAPGLAGVPTAPRSATRSPTGSRAGRAPGRWPRRGTASRRPARPPPRRGSRARAGRPCAAPARCAARRRPPGGSRPCRARRCRRRRTAARPASVSRAPASVPLELEQPGVLGQRHRVAAEPVGAGVRLLERGREPHRPQHAQAPLLLGAADVLGQPPGAGRGDLLLDLVGVDGEQPPVHDGVEPADLERLGGVGLVAGDRAVAGGRGDRAVVRQAVAVAHAAAPAAGSGASDGGELDGPVDGDSGGRSAPGRRAGAGRPAPARSPAARSPGRRAVRPSRS